jgi:hypothetical protein
MMFPFFNQRFTETDYELMKLFDRYDKAKEKQKSKGAMKITEETKIKELIPSGYELGTNESGYGDSGIVLNFKKKEVKDFNWYKDEFFKKSRMIKSLSPEYMGGILYHFSCGGIYYEHIPFEIRIGLLKFICDDLKMSWREFIEDRHKIGKPNVFGKVYSICPKEFINSLFE